MSFLIDPPLLYATGRTTAALPPDRAAAASAATAVVFLGTSISLYLNRPWTRPIWRLCRARDGRDWMLNSGIFRFEHRTPGPRTHAVSAALFATYPLWFWLGYRAGSSRTTTVSAMGMISSTGRSARDACWRIASGLVAS